MVPVPILNALPLRPPVMRKMGYEEGKGLGREGTGIVHAFSAEHTAPGAAKPGKKSSGWVQAKTAQGRLVNLNENEKEKQDKEKYGEPSRIVCLGNVVGGPHEVDDDLSGEVAQECSGYGWVSLNEGTADRLEPD